MTTNDRDKQIPLSDALYEFALTDTPRAEVLDDLTRRYPQHAAELTAFAIAWALEPARDDDEETVDSAAAETSAAVTRAMSRFQNKLYEVGVSAPKPVAVPAENPLLKLDREGVRALAVELDVNTLFVTRLRDRRIRPETIPPEFSRRVANAMKVPVEVISAHFGAGPVIHHAVRHKSDQKPEAITQQSFEEAARASQLTDAQLKKLLGK